MYTKFEYTTFILGRHPHIAAKYNQVLLDLQTDDPAFKKVLTAIKEDMEKNNTKEALSFATEADEAAYHVTKLAKQAAVQLISTGKVATLTMEDMSCLEEADFIKCIKESTRIANDINKVVKAAEKTALDDDVVPADMM